jgi:hypothetical protein
MVESHEKSQDSRETVQYVPVQYRKILDRHVTLSTITDWLSARECIIKTYNKHFCLVSRPPYLDKLCSYWFPQHICNLQAW